MEAIELFTRDEEGAGGGGATSEEMWREWVKKMQDLALKEEGGLNRGEGRRSGWGSKVKGWRPWP